MHKVIKNIKQIYFEVKVRMKHKYIHPVLKIKHSNRKIWNFTCFRSQASEWEIVKVCSCLLSEVVNKPISSERNHEKQLASAAIWVTKGRGNAKTRSLEGGRDSLTMGSVWEHFLDIKMYYSRPMGKEKPSFAFPNHTYKDIHTISNMFTRVNWTGSDVMVKVILSSTSKEQDSNKYNFFYLSHYFFLWQPVTLAGLLFSILLEM